jgi:uncharacterized protein (TIGR03067 family)
MKLLRLLIPLGCIVAACVIQAGDPASKTKCQVSQSTNAELQALQGTWEGGVPADKSHGNITITITGNSFLFHRDTNFWFDTTITLPAGANPKQFLATIKNSAGGDSIGKVVGAIYKIENETLIVVTGGPDSSPEGASKNFEVTGGSATRYELRKVDPLKKGAQPAKGKTNPPPTLLLTDDLLTNPR